MVNRSTFLKTFGAASLAVIAAPAPRTMSFPLQERVLVLARGGEAVEAPWTLDGRTIYKPGYYKLCAAFRDTHVDPVEGYVQIDPLLIDALWEIQQYYARIWRVYGLDRLSGERRPIIDILSGFRTPATNEAVGGVSGSFHMQARAADFKVRGIPVRHTGRVAAAMPSWLVAGIGVYNDDEHVHADTGKRFGTRRAIWCDHDEHVCSDAEL